MISLFCTGFLNHIRIRTSNDTLPDTKVLTAVKDGLQNTCTALLPTLGVLSIRCGSSNFPKNVWLILNPCPSQKEVKSGKKNLAHSFSFTYRYIDDVLSLNNSKFPVYLDFIYPNELENHEIYLMDGDVPRSTSYGVYISQLIQFARVSSHVVDFNARNKSLTAKLLQQGYRYHKLRKTFSKFYCRHYELVSKFNVGLKTLLHQGLSEPEFYGDLVYKNCR